MQLSEKKGAGEWQKDQDVWLAMLSGDMESLEFLFRRYYNDLFYYALKMCNHKEQAEDHIHETFLNLWERRQGLGKVEAVKAYLFTSLRNNILMEKRRSGHNHFETIYKLPQMQFSPEEIIITQEQKIGQRKGLKKALNELPVRQREVLFLKFYNSMSYEEIQQILGLNYQTVRNYVHEGLKILRAILEHPFLVWLIAASTFITVLLLLFM